MMIRDADGRRSMHRVVPGPRVLTGDELSTPSSRELAPSSSLSADLGPDRTGGWNGQSQYGFVGSPQ